MNIWSVWLPNRVCCLIWPHGTANKFSTSDVLKHLFYLHNYIRLCFFFWFILLAFDSIVSLVANLVLLASSVKVLVIQLCVQPTFNLNDGMHIMCDEWMRWDGAGHIHSVRHKCVRWKYGCEWAKYTVIIESYRSLDSNDTSKTFVITCAIHSRVCMRSMQKANWFEYMKWIYLIIFRNQTVHQTDNFIWAMEKIQLLYVNLSLFYYFV